MREKRKEKNGDRTHWDMFDECRCCCQWRSCPKFTARFLIAPMKFRDVVVAATVVDVTLVTVLRSVAVEVNALFTVTVVVVTDEVKK